MKAEISSQHFGEAILGLVYPGMCAGCGSVFRGDPGATLCPGCEDELERLAPPFCEVCGEAYFAASHLTFRCANCAGRTLHFDFAVAGYRARGRVRELIHRFKYRREYHLGRVLAPLLGDALGDERLGSSSWLMVPVPLHPRRRREREYNQSAELCRLASRRCGWPQMPALRRVRDTLHQAKLDREERLKNLDGAFALRRSRAVRDAIRGADVIVVDDVLTTGATTSECARVLREEGGAARVVAVTVARG